MILHNRLLIKSRFYDFYHVLFWPDFNKVFEIFFDASEIGIGGILNQHYHQVAYFNKKLNDTR